jgi:L-asparaginase II
VSDTTPGRTAVPAVILAEVVRSGFREGVHRGSLVVLDRDGSVALARGDVRSPIFPRSSNKLMQATGLVELGYAHRGELLALAAASHSGEPIHVAGVRRILSGAGLDESALQTPAEWPYGQEAARAVVRAGGAPEPVTMNCSGKHAAMLATCVERGFSLDDYLDATHPMQLHLAATLERLAGEQVAATGVDGCGAPVLAISLIGLARAFSTAVQAPPGSPERAVADAMRAYPEYVAGSDRDVTLLMAGVPGLLLKDGAEGVVAGALADGRAFAVKVDDGSERPRPLVTSAVLRLLGESSAVLDDFAVAPLQGGHQTVGEVRVPVGLLA